MHGTRVNMLTQQLLKEIAQNNTDEALDRLERAKLSMYTSNQLDIPERLRTALETNHLTTRYQERRLTLKREGQRISKALITAGLQHAFFKGACLLALAPDYIREMADLDLWLQHTEDLFQCWAYLNALGYRCAAEGEGCWLVNSTEPACHIGFISVDGEVYIDVHVGKRLSILGPPLELTTKPILIDGIMCLPLEECALLTLAHCAAEGRVTLRDCLDLAVFIDKGASIDRLQHLAQRCGLHRVFRVCLQTLYSGLRGKTLDSIRVRPGWHQWYWRALWHLIDIRIGHLVLRMLRRDLWYLESAVEFDVTNKIRIWNPCPTFRCDIYKLGKVAIFAKDDHALIGLQGLDLGVRETNLYDTIVGFGRADNMAQQHPERR